MLDLKDTVVFMYKAAIQWSLPEYIRASNSSLLKFKTNIKTLGVGYLEEV